MSHFYAFFCWLFHDARRCTGGDWTFTYYVCLECGREWVQHA